MKEQLELLYQLQQLDTRIGNLERTRRELDDGASLRREIEDLKKELEVASQQFKAIETEYHDKDLQLKGVEEKRKKDRNRLFSGTIGNPKELQDLNEEVKMLTKQKGEIEEALLLMMDELEARRAAVREKRGAIETKQKDLEQVERNYQETFERLGNEIAVLQEERKPFLDSVDESDLDIYDRIRARSMNLAVVKVERELCPGCSIKLTGFLLKKLRESDDIVYCESCGRILYLEGEE